MFVLDKRKKPLDPTTPARAKKLLRKGRARVHRLEPFTIRLIDRERAHSVVHDHVIAIDPGSRTTGIAVARVNETVNEETGEITTERTVVSLIELVHRGRQIKKKLEQRTNYRRRRRSKNLRYRKPRFLNRTRRGGWLAPSLQHRVDGVMNWVNRLSNLAPVSSIAVESVRFDTQALENPEISGIEYQQGTLHGYEVREYLLEKFDHTCIYCDATDVPLNLDHVNPRARGGSDRVSNLVLSCIPCNQAKGKQSLKDFVTNPARLARIRQRLRTPLRDAAAVNSTRHALVRALQETALPVETATGARTKWNRSQLGVPKTHALDALCVGVVDEVRPWLKQVLIVKATGRGIHQRTLPDKHGFPRLTRTRQKQHFGFITGDLVKATGPVGKRAGTHVGRVSVRARGAFSLTTATGPAFDVNYKYCSLRQRGDGYDYRREEVPGLLPDLKEGAPPGNEDGSRHRCPDRPSR